MILREKPGLRKSWALARFRTKGEALSCVQAGVVDPTSFTPTGLVLPAMETNGEGDVQLVVRWSSEASVAKNILSNQDGALADVWFELQSRADDLSVTKVYTKGTKNEEVLEDFKRCQRNVYKGERRTAWSSTLAKRSW